MSRHCNNVTSKFSFIHSYFSLLQLIWWCSYCKPPKYFAIFHSIFWRLNTFFSWQILVQRRESKTKIDIALRPMNVTEPPNNTETQEQPSNKPQVVVVVKEGNRWILVQGSDHPKSALFIGWALRRPLGLTLREGDRLTCRAAEEQQPHRVWTS